MFYLPPGGKLFRGVKKSGGGTVAPPPLSSRPTRLPDHSEHAPPASIVTDCVGPEMGRCVVMVVLGGKKPLKL